MLQLQDYIIHIQIILNLYTPFYLPKTPSQSSLKTSVSSSFSNNVLNDKTGLVWLVRFLLSQKTVLQVVDKIGGVAMNDPMAFPRWPSPAPSAKVEKNTSSSSFSKADEKGQQ